MTRYSIHGANGPYYFDIDDDTKLSNCHWRKQRGNDGRRKEKIGYPTKHDAKQMLKKLKNKKMSVYLCRVCGMWHLGNHNN